MSTPSGRASRSLATKLRTTTAHDGRVATSERSSATPASGCPHRIRAPAFMKRAFSSPGSRPRARSTSRQRPGGVAPEEEVFPAVAVVEGVGRPQEPFDLVERPVVVVDADVDDDALPGMVVALCLDDEDGRRHAAAGVTAGALRRPQGAQETLGKAPGARLVGLGHGRPHGGAGHHVGLHGVLRAHMVPGVVDAEFTGVGAHRAGPVDHGHLADGRSVVGITHLVERPAGAGPRRQPVEALRSVGHVDHGLGGHRSHAGDGPGDDGPHGEPARLDGHSQLTAVGVAGDDGVGHGPGLPQAASALTQGRGSGRGRRTPYARGSA